MKLIIDNLIIVSVQLYQQFNKIYLWFYLKVSLCSSATITNWKYVTDLGRQMKKNAYCIFPMTSKLQYDFYLF